MSAFGRDGKNYDRLAKITEAVRPGEDLFLRVNRKYQTGEINGESLDLLDNPRGLGTGEEPWQIWPLANKNGA